MLKIGTQLLLVVLLGFASDGQSVANPFYVEKSAGETVFLTIHISVEADTINVYRKTGVTTTPSKIGSITMAPGAPGQLKYELQYIMPGGTTKEYRFFAVPVRGSEFLEESNGVRVRRK